MRFSWTEELVRLNEAIRPIAERPVDLRTVDDVAATSPMDEAGVRTRAQALLLEILGALEAGTDEERNAIRSLVSEHESFFWAVYPPEAETAEQTLRRRLLHFALIDQYPDSRDAVLRLEALCQTPDVSPQRLADLRREVASIASDEDRFGFGSTRSMLLRGYSSGYGKRGAPRRDG